MIDPQNHEAISPDLAGYSLDALDEEARELVEQHLAGAGQQGSAGFGKLNLAAHPVKQTGAKLLFEQGNTLADGGLGDVKALCGSRKRAGFGHRHEGAEGRRIYHSRGIQLFGCEIIIGYLKNEKYELDLLMGEPYINSY